MAWPPPVPLVLAAHAVQHQGQSIDLVGLALAAAASWFGLPGPGEPVLIASAVLAAQHRLSLLPILIVAWLAATMGGIAGWVVGRRAGRAILTGPGPLRRVRLRAVQRSEMLVGRHPVIAVLLTPSWVAGIHRVRSMVFHPVNALSAAAWAFGIGIAAYEAGPTVIDVVNDVGVGASIVLVVLLAAALAVEVRRRRLQARRAGPDA